MAVYCAICGSGVFGANLELCMPLRCGSESCGVLLTLLPLVDIAGVESDGVSCGSKLCDLVGEKSRYEKWLDAQLSMGSPMTLAGLHESSDIPPGVSGGMAEGSSAWS